MKKNIGYTAVAYFIFRASSLNIITSILAPKVKQDIWISVLLGIILGLFPILIFYYIAKNNKGKNILNCGSKLFPNKFNITKITLGLFSFLYTLIILLNISTFIKNQYLDNTPSIIITISLLLPVVYLLNQKEKTIPRVAFILSIISIVFILCSIIGLTDKISLGNISPILEYNPFNGIIPYISYSVLPIYLLLIFPNKEIKNSIITGYIISSITIFISIFYLISILGIDLVSLFKYPEVQTLKNAFNNTIYVRVANFLSLQWILDSFIFITMGIKFTNKSLNLKNNYIIPIILIIFNTMLFSKFFIYEKFIYLYFPYISLTLLFIFIFMSKKKEDFKKIVF